MSVNRHPRLLTAGITFRDLVISGIDELPGLGEERYGTDFVTIWGGVANTARIAASLGARVQLLDRSRRRPQLRDVLSGIDRVGH